MTAAESRRAARARRGERARPLHELQHPLLPAWCRRRGRASRDGELGERLERPRRLPAGLAAAADRLELAARARAGRRAARGRRHRLALARPRPVRHRPRVESVLRRPRDHDSRCGGGRPARSRRSRPPATSSASTRRCRPRTSRTSCCASSGGARGVGRRLAGQRRAARTRCASRSTARGGALAWDSRATRGAVARPPRPAQRGAAAQPGADGPDGARRTHLPAGHAEGFADTFRELYRAVYRRSRRAAAGRARLSDLRRRPRRERARRGDRAVDRERRWVEVTQ